MSSPPLVPFLLLPLVGFIPVLIRSVYTQGLFLLFPFCLTSVVMGLIGDACLVHFGLISFGEYPSLLGVPYWMLLLWLNFALMLRPLFEWFLDGRWRCLLGFSIGGALAYYSGHQFEVLTFEQGWSTAIAVATEWALPVLYFVTSTWRSIPSQNIMTTLKFLLYGQAACSVIMLIGWLFALRSKNASYVDVLWFYGVGVLGIFYLFYFSDKCDPGRLALFQGLLGVWSIRLGTHLLRRCWGKPEDARYAYLREVLGKNANLGLFAFFQIQAFLDRSLCLSFSHPRTKQGTAWLLGSYRYHHLDHWVCRGFPF